MSTAAPTFKNDSLYWYNVPGWEKFGLAVPNWGESFQSQNDAIRKIVRQIGRNLQHLMFSVDAKLRTPPTINTLMRVHKLCIRARSILGSRGVDAATPNMESRHSMPAPEEHLVYPVPYFTVENEYLKEYCYLALTAMTEALQHSENARPLEISNDFAGLVGQYFHRMYRNMAVELFAIPIERARALDFTLSDEELASYNPSKFFTSTEMLDTVPNLDNWPTEIDLRPLTNGIPISQLPVLGRWPSGPRVTATGAAASTPVTGSFAPPPTA